MKTNPYKYVIVNKIVDHIHLGRRYTDVRQLITCNFPMCESTFVKYWKLAQVRHYEECHDVEHKLKVHYVLQLAEYKKRFGEL